MKDNAPHRQRPLYSALPVVILLLFFGAAISVWGESRLLAIITAIIGVFVYRGLTKVRTRMMQEELTLRELFRNW